MNQLHSSFFLRLLLVAALAAGGGCGWILDDEGWIRDREGEYREARAVPPPRVPGDLSAEAIDEAMFIPEVEGMQEYLAQDDFELPRPATLFAPEEDRQVRIQRFGDASWVVAPDPPAAIWPRVKQFLSDNGVRIADEIPPAGIIETQWIELGDGPYGDVVRSTLAGGAAPARHQRLRLRVEQAVRRGATEIHLDQLGARRPAADPDWPERSTEPAVADDLLRELAGYLAADVGETGVSLLAQNIAAEAKAEIVRRPVMPPALRLRLPQERAWATVVTALDNARIPVTAQDPDERTFEVRFDPRMFSGEERGWFSRLFSFGSDDPAKRGDPFTLQLQPAPDEQAWDLVVLGDEGERRVERESAEELLGVVREYAS